MRNVWREKKKTQTFFYGNRCFLLRFSEVNTHSPFAFLSPMAWPDVPEAYWERKEPFTNETSWRSSWKDVLLCLFHSPSFRSGSRLHWSEWKDFCWQQFAFRRDNSEDTKVQTQYCDWNLVTVGILSLSSERPEHYCKYFYIFLLTLILFPHTVYWNHQTLKLQMKLSRCSLS